MAVTTSTTRTADPVGSAATGGLDVGRRTWAGTLTQADVVFVDGDARLIQPVTLTLGPDLQRASPLCLRTAEDERLCVEGEHQTRPQSWRVIYSAQDWPLRRIAGFCLCIADRLREEGLRDFVLSGGDTASAVAAAEASLCRR